MYINNNHKMGRRETNPLTNGMLKLDPDSGNFLIYKDGDWVVFANSVQDEKIYKRSMGKMTNPDSDFAGNIGFSNQTNGFSSLALGKMSRTYLKTQEAYSSGSFEKNGDSQTTRFIVKSDVAKNEETELLIDDDNYVMPSRKASIYLNIKFFVQSRSGPKKHWVMKTDFILRMEGRDLVIENLRTKNFPEGWEFSISGDEKEVNFVCKCPIESRWVGICKTIEII